MRTLTALAALAFALAIAPAAAAHLPHRAPAGASLEQRERVQLQNLRHAEYVCRRGARAHRRWACWAASSVVRANGQGWLRAAHARTLERLVYRLGPHDAIRATWPASEWSNAISVASCETGGTFSVYARNGQYLGLFQMGESERARFGHGWTAIEQARAAYAYWLVSGWSPWQCLPGGGLRW